MNAITWIAGLDNDEDLHLGRWVTAIVVVLAAHAGIGAAYMYMKPEVGITGADVPTLMIEFAPEAAAPETPVDATPGPESMDSQAAMQPEARPEAAEEPIIELPQVTAPDPDIVIPPKKEEVAKPEEIPQPTPPEPVEKPVQQSVNQVKAAPPKFEKIAPKPVAPQAGTTSARNAIADYASTLSVHLRRFKRQPPGSAKGVVVVRITLDRRGSVLESKITRSSGSSVLDDAALSVISRAQPIPPFPANMTVDSYYFDLPIRYN